MTDRTIGADVRVRADRKIRALNSLLDKVEDGDVVAADEHTASEFYAHVEKHHSGMGYSTSAQLLALKSVNAVSIQAVGDEKLTEAFRAEVQRLYLELQGDPHYVPLNVS